jgi:hypothetical protein
MFERRHPECRRATRVAMVASLVAAASLTGPVLPERTVAAPGLRTDLSHGAGRLPEVSADDATVAEGDSATRSLMFTLRLSEQSIDTVSVEVATCDSTATVANADYAPAGVRIVFAPGSLAESLAVAVTGDTRFEPAEHLLLRLTLPSGAVLADSVATGSIANDDLPAISVRDTAMAEGDAGVRPLGFRVRLESPVEAAVTFHFQLVDHTAAAADGDFVAVAGDTLFAPGQDELVLEVPVLGDSLLEGNERFSLRLTDVQGAVPGELSALGTICNDERARWERYDPPVPAHIYGTLPPAFGDFDGDGMPDLPLYLNSLGGFVEMPGMRSLLGTGNYHGSAWCDFDRDGDMDLVQTPYPNNASPDNYTHLFENTPGGLVEVGVSLGFDVVGFGETPSWGDFNADGWPDLFVPYYSHVAPFRSCFYIGLGNGGFLECADSAGVSLPNVPFQFRPEGVAVADWNGDGALDLYCASRFFLNDGDARFSDVRAQVGLPAVFDEGANFVDFDDDGDLDLYLRTAEGPTLFRNQNGLFVQATATLGLGTVGWGWGDRWADLDSDGDQDLLYIAPGASPRLLLNRGDGTFREDSSFIGVVGPSSLSSFADVDGDGDLDIAIGDYDRQLARNLLEQVPRARTPYLKVRVEEADGLLTAHGATVCLRSLDDPRHPVQTRVVDGGSGYLGQDEYTLTFGGVGSGAFDLEVSYPSRPGSPRVVGPRQNPLLGGVRPGDAAPQLVVVRPGGEISVHAVARPMAPTASALALRAATAFRPAFPNPARASTRFEFTLAEGAVVSLEVLDLTGRRVRTLVREGRLAGPGNASWDLRDDFGRPVPAGLYFARLVRDGRSASTQRVAVVR